MQIYFNPPEPLEQHSRFWAKVIFPEDLTQCWLWSAYVSRSGYGWFTPFFRSNPQCAHRYAYELLVGRIPAGLHIDHLCRVRNCVNPDHLEAVTSKENILRGIGVTAQNARKTHCPQGHPYSGANLKINLRGYRKCRLCDNRYVREWRLRKKESAR